MSASKQQLREVFKTRRQQLTAAHRSQAAAAIATLLLDWLKARQPSAVFAFLSHQLEPDLKPLLDSLDQLGVALGLPVIGTTPGTMAFYGWRPQEPLARSRFGTSEPADLRRLLQPDAQTVIIVPSLALAADGTRLGYGAGFYDRYLAEAGAQSATVGVAFSACLALELPREATDVALQYICTERGLNMVTT